MKSLKLLALACLFLSSSYATDFSSLSTEQLMGMRGTLALEDRPAFHAEVQKRMQTMSQEEKQKFNLGRGLGGGQGQKGNGIGKQGKMGKN